MAMHLETTKAMCKAVRYSVNGYLRRCQKLLPSNEPYFDLHGHDIIISYILLFYGETDVFEINNEPSFKYSLIQYNRLFHIFGKNIIDRQYFDKYQWKVEISCGFDGRLGIIREIQTNKVENGRQIWHTNYDDTATAASLGWAGRIFGSSDPDEYTSSFIDASNEDDIIIIDLDYNINQVTFTSQKTNKTRVGSVLKHIKSVKFIAEINRDSSISFK